MAKTAQEAQTVKEGFVPVIIPKDPANKHESAKFVGVNGKSYLVKRGETVYVPPEVAEVLRLASISEAEAETYLDSNELS